MNLTDSRGGVQPQMEIKQPIQFKTFFNPTSEDLTFYYDSAPYTVKAGQQENFVDYIAEHGAKKLADRNVKTSDSDEHRVLMQAYLENSSPEVIAKNLGINLEKIRKEALSKEAERARVINLEAQMAYQKVEIEKLKALIEKTVDLTEKQIEDTPKSFKCEICGKEFDQAIALAGHSRSHK